MDPKTAQAFRLFPEQASTSAVEVDHLFYFLLAVSIFFTVLILVLVGYFAVRYRRRSSEVSSSPDIQSRMLELTWCIVPFALMMVMFVWGAKVYAKIKRPPENAIQINVVGKQWMWQVQHAQGAREINALHVPAGVPVRLIMASQDVIHSFSIPVFRIKQDVVPGSFSSEWFVATTPGVYRIFCAQYCGTEHSKMVGFVTVLPAEDYQSWLAGAPSGESTAAAGARLFTSWGCSSACHAERAPTMAGLYLSKVLLDNGSTVVADEDYLRESITEPSAKVVAGYPPIMPSYRGQLSEEQILDLVAYIKSLGVTAAPAGMRTVPATQPANGQSPTILPNYPPARQPPPIEPQRGDRN